MTQTPEEKKSTLIRELRLCLFMKFLRIAILFLPNDAEKTLRWITQLPFEK